MIGLLLAALIVAVFAVVIWPAPSPTSLLYGDGSEYAHLAQSLLHGSVMVDYDSPPRLTRYTPGFSLLLMPAVALGGLDAAVWVPFIAALVLGGLAAFLAFRLAGGVAAPLAVLLAIINPGVSFGAKLVMSDVPSAALALSEVALLATASRVTARPTVVAGLLAGYLVWLRPAAIVLLAAGVVGLSARDRFRWRATWYIAGAALPVLLLAGWQWLALGSPLTTSYQATGASATGGSDLGSFVSLAYVIGPPWNAYAAGSDPNIVVYSLWVLGIDNPELIPGVGALGLIGATLLGRDLGPRGVVGRFTLLATIGTLLVYVPYFYREPRFLMIPAALINTCAAVVLANLLAKLRVRLSPARDQRGVPASTATCASAGGPSHRQR